MNDRYRGEPPLPLSGRSASARHVLQFGKWCQNGAGTKLGCIFNHTIESPIDEENGPLARLTVAAIGLAWRITQASDIPVSAVHLAQDRLGHGSISNPDRVVEVGSHECEFFGAEIIRERLIAPSPAPHESNRSTVLAARAGCNKDSQHQHRDTFWQNPQLQSVA